MLKAEQVFLMILQMHLKNIWKLEVQNKENESLKLF